jgi:hypothetical protein
VVHQNHMCLAPVVQWRTGIQHCNTLQYSGDVLQTGSGILYPVVVVPTMLWCLLAQPPLLELAASAASTAPPMPS